MNRNISIQRRLASGNTKSKQVYDESATTITTSMSGSAYSSSYLDYSNSSMHGDCVQSTKQCHILGKTFKCQSSEDAASDAISGFACDSASWLSLDQLKSDIAPLQHGPRDKVDIDNDDESSISSLRLEDITMDTTAHCCNKNAILQSSDKERTQQPAETTEYNRPIKMAHDSLTLPQYNHPMTDSLNSWMSNSSIAYDNDVDSDDEDDEDDEGISNYVGQSLSSEIVTILRKHIKNLSMKLKAEEYIQVYQIERQQKHLLPEDHTTGPDDSISNYMYDSFSSLSHSLAPSNVAADREKAITSKAKEGIYESIRHLEESFSVSKKYEQQHLQLLDDIKQRYNEFVHLSTANEGTLKGDYEKKLQQSRDNELKIIELQKKLLKIVNID
jgi:hypothetical protein